MRTLAVLALVLTLSGCSLPVFFRVPIVQGNIVTPKQVSQLQLGMTKKQVAYVLGTPLVNPSFDNDRWDYVFYYRNPRAHVRQSKLNLFFVDGKLDDMQGSEEYTAQILKGQNGNTPMPGKVGTPGAAPSIQQTNGRPINASNRIPLGNTPRPGAISPSTREPTSRPTQNNPMPNTGAPLPGQPQ